MSAVEDVLGLEASVYGSPLDPAFAFDGKRNQYSSTLLLKRLVEMRPARAYRVLGITEGDLYIPMLSFVFGQAQVGGPAALVSVARLRQEFYRLPVDEELLGERIQKEVLHELGHTLSLIHCPEPSCVMSLATGVSQVDRKSVQYCGSCRAVMGLAQMESRQ